MTKTNPTLRLRSARVVGPTRLRHIWIVLLVAAVPWVMIVRAFFAQRAPISRLTWHDVAGLEYRWQTLITGGLAVQAAFIGGFFIYQQITRDDRADREAQERRLQAELATFPMLLSDLMDHLAVSANYGRELLEKICARSLTTAPHQPYRLDRALVGQMRGLVEGGDPELTVAARTLLKKLQILESRVSDLARSHSYPHYMPPNRFTVLGVLADAAEVYAMVEKLFPYARDDKDERGQPIVPTASVTLKDIQGAGVKMFASVPDVDGLKEEIERRFRLRDP